MSVFTVDVTAKKKKNLTILLAVLRRQFGIPYKIFRKKVKYLAKKQTTFGNGLVRGSFEGVEHVRTQNISTNLKKHGVDLVPLNNLGAEASSLAQPAP